MSVIIYLHPFLSCQIYHHVTVSIEVYKFPHLSMIPLGELRKPGLLWLGGSSCAQLQPSSLQQTLEIDVEVMLNVWKPLHNHQIYPTHPIRLVNDRKTPQFDTKPESQGVQGCFSQRSKARRCSSAKPRLRRPCPVSPATLKLNQEKPAISSRDLPTTL